MYTFSHFCVDFACFFMLFAVFKPAAPSIDVFAIGLLLYNVLAFGLQPVIGFFFDEHRAFPVSLAGIALLLLGCALFRVPWASLVLCAVGNAFFHVGGGVDSLVYAGGKLSRSGIFVSSGALGVSLGTLGAQGGYLPPLVPASLLAVSGVLIALFAREGKGRAEGVSLRVSNGRIGFAAVLLLCAVSIVIRSFVGFAAPMPWKSTALLVFLASAASFAGKAAGGFAADLLGARTAGTLSLALSLPLLCFFPQNAALCLLGIALFNMTMPITLCAIASRLNQNPGLAFGLTTLCLLCGNVPTFFFALPPAAAPVLLAVCVAASALCVFLATANAQRRLSSHAKTDSQPLEHAL